MREMGVSRVWNCENRRRRKYPPSAIFSRQAIKSGPVMWPVLSIENRYLYICVILELFSRKVIAHKVSRKTARSSLWLHSKWRMSCVSQRQDSFFTVTADFVWLCKRPMDFRKELMAVRHRGSDLENQTACSQNLNCSHFYVTFYFRIPFLKKACAARISHIKQPYLIW